MFCESCLAMQWSGMLDRREATGSTTISLFDRLIGSNLVK